MPVLGLVYGLGLGVHGRGGRVFREGSEGVVHAGLAVLARGVRILLRGTTHPGACFSAIVTRSAGSLCERACGMPFTCRHQRVVRLSATLLMLAGAAQRDACDGVCACAPALQG